MHFTASLLAVLATAGFAFADPQFRISPYRSPDTTCDQNNLISPTVNINDAFGGCNQLPAGTNSIQYSYLDGSRTGCKVQLWTNNNCLGGAINPDYSPSVGETKCVPPLGGGWQSIKVVC